MSPLPGRLPLLRLPTALLLLLLAHGVAALNNGLAARPPMGWNTWVAYQGRHAPESMESCCTSMPLLMQWTATECVKQATSAYAARSHKSRSDRLRMP